MPEFSVSMIEMKGGHHLSCKTYLYSTVNLMACHYWVFFLDHRCENETLHTIHTAAAIDPATLEVRSKKLQLSKLYISLFGLHLSNIASTLQSYLFLCVCSTTVHRQAFYICDVCVWIKPTCGHFLSPCAAVSQISRLSARLQFDVCWQLWLKPPFLTTFNRKL